MKKNIKIVEERFSQLHKDLIKNFYKHDTGVSEKITKWKYKYGGGGTSCLMISKNVFEKVMINFSSIKGKKLPNSALKTRSKNQKSSFRAIGVSVVAHPKNPFIPCSHFNVRFFVTDEFKNNKCSWFGGGYDLTPYFAYKEDIKLWHANSKLLCKKHNKNFTLLKKTCDDYFYLEHRNEKRGVGGIFFDNLNTKKFDNDLNFVTDVGLAYQDSYNEIISRRKRKKYSKNHRLFQLYRRGRYVEFNLLYDRGTTFGLQSGGRPESILMSLPPMVSWVPLKTNLLRTYNRDLLKFIKK